MSTEKEITAKLFFVGSLLLSVFISSSTIYTIYTPNFYVLETPNWQIQSIAQDIFDLFFVVPVLIISAIFVHKLNKIALLLWGGALLYVIYSYMIYCFSIHFNSLFIVYCCILGISLYLFLYLLYFQFSNPSIRNGYNNRWTYNTAIYFIFISIAFYTLWLFDIVPAIHNQTLPKALADTGLPSNAVYVLDLSILLPGMLITAVLLFQKKQLGFVMAPILLSFFILMSASIAVISLLLKEEGFTQGYEVVVAMCALVITSSLLLVQFLKKNSTVK